MLFLESAGGVLIINFLTSFLKNTVFPRWGTTGVHAIVFTFSVVVASVIKYFELDGVMPTMKELGLLIFNVYTAAVAVYELVLKRTGM